jgi:hypothetical protein
MLKQKGRDHDALTQGQLKRSRPPTGAALLSYKTHHRAPDHVAVTPIVQFNIRHPEQADGYAHRGNAFHLKILLKWQ